MHGQSQELGWLLIQAHTHSFPVARTFSDSCWFGIGKGRAGNPYWDGERNYLAVLFEEAACGLRVVPCLAGWMDGNVS